MQSSASVAKAQSRSLSMNTWMRLALSTALASIVAVLIIQALTIALWPEIALFAPLDSYPRSALFTAIPVIGATMLLGWLAQRQQRPVRTFMIISVIVLLVSFIPDYVLPVPNKTMLASTVAAFLHVVAAVMTVGMLVRGYERAST